MIFSPKYMFFGLSGTGLIGGGIAAWQLTKNNNLKSLNVSERRYKEYVEEIRKECGDESFWEEKEDLEAKNEKGKNYAEYDTCKDNMMEKHYPNPDN